MKKKWLNGYVIGLLITCIVIFTYGVNVRKTWFGVLTGSENDGTGHHQWLTGSTIIFANNWRVLNPLKVNFALLQTPPSIDTENARYHPYGSYPPGAVLPIYILSLMANKPATPALVMYYNLFIQFSLTILLSLTVYLITRSIALSKLQSLLISVVPVLWINLVPGPMYWLQNVYFSDQAVLLPIAALIYLEARKDIGGKRNVILESILLFLAVLTDWLAVFFAFGLYLKRLINGEIAVKKWFIEGIKLSIPVLLAVALFVIQIISSGLWQDTVNRAAFRLGVAASESGIYYRNVFISQLTNHFTTAYGKLGLPLMAIYPLVFLLTSKWIGTKKRMLVSWSTLLYGSVVLQMAVFNNHTSVHDFSTLKTLIPLATLIMSIWPATIISEWKKYKNIAIAIILMISLVYTVYLHRRFETFFPPVSHEYEQVGAFIRSNTSYEDVVVSPDYEILVNPPQKLSYSGKLVHKISNLEEVNEITKNIKSSYRVKMLITGENEPSWVQDFRGEILRYSGI